MSGSTFDKLSAAFGGNEKAPDGAVRGEGEPTVSTGGWTMDSTGNGRSHQGTEPIKICARDAWVARRLLCGKHEPSDLEACSPAFRPVAERLARASFEDKQRDRDFYKWLDDQGDAFADAFEAAMRAVDPNGPPPAEGEAVADGQPPSDNKAPQVVMRRFSDIQSRSVEWLWRDRVPLGMLSLFAGDPKIGKSFATVDFAAAVSRGAPLPRGDVPDSPGSVVLLNAEDDPERTIRPRLESAGASLDKIHILEAIRLKDGAEALPSLAADIDRIGQAVEQVGDCRLVVIDPVSAYLGGIDDHRNAELRGVLSPLKTMAARLNVAVVLVTHLNKSQGGSAKHRVTGSIAYVGACRMNFLFIRDRDNPGRTLMLPNGCNLAPADLPGLAYRVEDRGEGPMVVWDSEPVSMDADEALAAEREAQREQNRDDGARECDDWLREALSHCSMSAAEIEKAARPNGFTSRQLRSAKERIGVASKRQGFGPEAKWFWTLPTNQNPEANGRKPSGLRIRATS